MRTISAVTVGRSDYGIYLPVLRQIQEESDLHLQLMVSGAHLSDEFGLTVKDIEVDGFEIRDRVEMLRDSDSPEGVTKSMGLGVMGFGEAFSRRQPDILLVLGDRFEMHAAALAALPFKLPVAHIHGGEVTHGAIDDSLRHSITKLSHLHFVSTEEYRERVMQLGEDPANVIVSGAPSLDNLNSIELMTSQELETDFGLTLAEKPLVVTYHPVTLGYEDTKWQVGEMLAALDECGLQVVFTAPNADTGGRVIRQMLEEHVESHPKMKLVENLGTKAYFSLMSCSLAMVGNSSSGIIEAPSFGLPAVNIGSRQSGRVRGRNVIDVGYSKAEVLSGIGRALEPAFQAEAKSAPNPYGDGKAAIKITEHLKSVVLGQDLVQKKFVDQPVLSKQLA